MGKKILIELSKKEIKTLNEFSKTLPTIKNKKKYIDKLANEKLSSTKTTSLMDEKGNFVGL